MTEERRTSVRRASTLPFAWCKAPATASPAELCRLLNVPAALTLQNRLAELDEEFRRLATTLDARTADALRALDGKLGVLEEGLLAQWPEPPLRPLAVSADGIGFSDPEPLPVDEWLAVHLVLPVSYHLVCRARVMHCDAEGDTFAIGAAFVDIPLPAGRRLTRYAIGRDREVPAE